VLEPARLYAQESGIELVAEEVVGLQDLEATSQMLRIKEAQADFVFIQETYTATATVLKEAQKHNMTNVIFAGNYWSVGRKVAELAGNAAEGFLSITPFAIWSDDNEGVAFAKSLNAKYHPDVEYRESQYMAGIANAMVMIHAIEMALENASGDPAAVTGASVHAAFEQMNTFDTMGITGPISYGPSERRGSRQGRMVSIQNGDLVSVSDWIDAPPVPESERLGEE
jgi:branched-chain amino acid transport system substrate-binding protein